MAVCMMRYKLLLQKSTGHISEVSDQNMVQLSSKITFTHVWNACETRLGCAQDVCVSTKPCDKASAKLT